MKKRLYLISALCILLIMAVAFYFYLSHKKSSQNQGALPLNPGQTPAVSTPVAAVSGTSEPVTSPSTPPSPETTKLLNELQDPKTSEAEKIRIMTILGKQKEANAFPILLTMITDGPEKLRLEAILAIARYDDMALRLQTLNLIHDRCNDDRLKAGIQALKAADRYVDLPELKTLAAHSSDLFVLKLLALYAYDENADVRLSVIEWLEPYDKDNAKYILVHLLKDEEFRKTDSLRLALFFALKKWKDNKEVVQCLTENFDKEHYPDWFEAK